jgi:hypothetical protein
MRAGLITRSGLSGQAEADPSHLQLGETQKTQPGGAGYGFQEAAELN